MSSNEYNKIVSTVNTVTSNYSYMPDPNNLICLDTSNNRIGINTLNPEYALDINNGMIKANDFMFLDNSSNNIHIKSLLKTIIDNIKNLATNTEVTLLDMSSNF